MSRNAQPGPPGRNIFLLALLQAAVMTSTSLLLAASAVIGVSLASPALATVPLAVQYLSTMAVLTPLARLIARFGHRPLFIAGALLGAGGLSIAALAIQQQSFLLFVLAGIPVGAFNAVGQYYRFAAADAVAVDLRSRAISLTLSGGVLAALLGPNLARWTRDALGMPFLASFLVLALIALLAAALSAGLRLPLPAKADQGAPVPLRTLLGQPAILLALVAGVLGYALMNLLMTATPLAMLCQHLDFADTALVIQWHVVAMFAPSFFTGHLIRRLGAVAVMLLGGLSVLGCIAVAVHGVSLGHFQGALILLGIGWNFLYVGATTRLVECCPPAQKARLQACNDTLIYLAIAGATLGSGPLVDRFGWLALNQAAAVPLLLLLAWLSIALIRARSYREALA